MPPSPGGSRSGTSTRRPASPSRARGALEQEPVLEHAAGEDDRVARGPPPRAGPRRRGASASWKRAATRPARRRDARSSTIAARPGGGRAGRRRRDRGVRTPLRRVGARLELDRRLALVGDLGAQAAERRHGVEQPPHAARQRRGQPGAGQPETSSQRPRRRAASAAGASLRPPAATRRPCARAGGSPPRRRACGPRTAAPRARTRQVADQQLAAPDRAVGAVAGAVVDRPQRGAGMAVLGQAGGEVGVMVLHADEITPSRSSACLVERYSGCRSWATTSGWTSNSASKCSMPSTKERRVS